MHNLEAQNTGHIYQLESEEETKIWLRKLARNDD